MSSLLDHKGSLRAPTGGITERWHVDPDTGLVVREQAEDVEMVLKHNQHLKDTLPSHHGQAAWRHCASIPQTLAAQFARECGHAPGSREFAEYAKKQIITKYPKLLVKGW
jgi:hypothetical protein